MTTLALIVLALACTPFTWVIIAGVAIGAVMDRPDRPKRRHPAQLPARRTNPYLARMNALTQIAEQKQRKTR